MELNLNIVKKEITFEELIKEEITVEDFSLTFKNEEIETTDCFIEKYDYEAVVQDYQMSADAYLCGHCIYSSFTKEVLEDHIKREHLEPYHFVCRRCNVKCYEHIKKTQLKQNNKLICCNKCYFTSKPLKKQDYQCSICKKTFKWKGNLNTHLKIHTGEKPYVCKICQYKTGDKVNFNRHSKIHRSERNHTCPQCTFKTYRKDNLTVHLKIHSGEKNFACNYCEFRAIRKASLILHLKTHNKASRNTNPSKITSQTNNKINKREKMFVCQLCDYKTFYKGHLTRHLKKHTGEKPHMCKICNYKSSERSDLKKHFRTHLRRNSVKM